MPQLLEVQRRFGEKLVQCFAEQAGEDLIFIHAEKVLAEQLALD